jgi:hypothetical protein
MKYLRVTMIALALAAASIGIGVAAIDKTSAETQGTNFCQRCGDGFCAKSCENAQTCPRDCAPGGGGTTAH